MQRRGSTRAWRRVRALVLERDGYRCQLRLPGCTVAAPLHGGPGVAGHAHHTIGTHTGLDPDYLVAACAHCNLAVGDPSKFDPSPRPRTRW